MNSSPSQDTKSPDFKSRVADTTTAPDSCSNDASAIGCTQSQPGGLPIAGGGHWKNAKISWDGWTMVHHG